MENPKPNYFQMKKFHLLGVFTKICSEKYVFHRFNYRLGTLFGNDSLGDVILDDLQLYSERKHSPLGNSQHGVLLFLVELFNEKNSLILKRYGVFSSRLQFNRTISIPSQ